MHIATTNSFVPQVLLDDEVEVAVRSSLGGLAGVDVTGVQYRPPAPDQLPQEESSEAGISNCPRTGDLRGVSGEQRAAPLGRLRESETLQRCR